MIEAKEVRTVKEVMACDVSPVAMFEKEEWVKDIKHCKNLQIMSLSLFIQVSL